MRRWRLFSFRTIVVFAGALLCAAAGYGFAAGNTLSASRAGDGAQPITSYVLDTTTAPNTTTSLHVSLQTNGDPTRIVKVRFTIVVPGGAAPPQSVRTQFLTAANAPIGGWYSACGNIGGNTWECLPGGTPANVQIGIKLRVVAAQ